MGTRDKLNPRPIQYEPFGVRPTRAATPLETTSLLVVKAAGHHLPHPQVRPPRVLPRVGTHRDGHLNPQPDLRPTTVATEAAIGQGPRLVLQEILAPQPAQARVDRPAAAPDGQAEPLVAVVEVVTLNVEHVEHEARDGALDRAWICCVHSPPSRPK